MSAASVLIVDNSEYCRGLLSDVVVTLGHDPITAVDSASAIEQLARGTPDVILLSATLPNGGGLAVLERARNDASLRHVPVVILSGPGDADRVAEFILRGADDYLVRPFNPLLIQARIAACLEQKRFHDEEELYRRAMEEYNLKLEEHVREQVQEISSTQLATIFAMSKLAESRDPETGEHLDRMREYVRILAAELRGTPKYARRIDAALAENMYAASPLHDIGKVGIPDRILLKPGKLTPDEFAIMKQHSRIGAKTLEAVFNLHPRNEFIRTGIEIAEYHHERWDGAGYPHGLAGEDIPVAGRITALADVYDALTSKRAYKEAWSHEASRDTIVQGRSSQFDADVVDAFLATEQQFLAVRKSYPDSEKILLV